MKKWVYIIFSILAFFSVKTNIIAKECKYKYEGKAITITTTKDETTNEINVEYNIDSGIERDEDYNFITGSIFSNDEQCLETITVCRYDKNDYNLMWDILSLGGTAIYTEINGERHLALFGSSLDPSTLDSAVANEFDSISDKGFWETHFWTGNSESCKIVEYSGDDKDSLKETGNLVSYCDKFFSMYTSIASAYQEYGRCEYDKTLSLQQKNRCKANAFTEINKEVDKLKTTCNSILQNSGINVKDGCASSCLGAKNTLKTLKEKYGLDVNQTTECSFSGRLAIWFSNIIRWIKYITPVIVIILGTLDFIKATGSSKEDEIKKAQGKFIKRLVSAALIFIAPFIIQFILEQMGFSANGCGIIDL